MLTTWYSEDCLRGVGLERSALFYYLQTDMFEKRIYKESGVAARIATIIEPVLQELGFRLVRVRVTGERGCTVQIMAERPDGRISVEDCETISHAVSPILELEDPIATAYHLEVSSPGMDRPLVRESDFVQWKGYTAKIEMTIPAHGRSLFRGIISETRQDGVYISLPDAPDIDDKEVFIPFSDIAKARLVLTDDLIREALRRETVPQIQDEEDVEVLAEPPVTQRKTKKTNS